MNNNNRSKTIVIFYSYYAPHVGGLEKYTYSLCKALTSKGHKVILITALFDNKLKPYEECPEATIYRFPIEKNAGNRYPIFKKSNLSKVFSELSKINIDLAIIQARFYLLTLWAAKYTKKNNIPSICIDHGNAHLTVQNKLLDSMGAVYEHFLTGQVKKYISNFYAVSNASLKWLEHFGIKGKGVLYNSIDKSEIGSLKKYIKKPKDDTVITFAGRMIEDKGVLHLVKAFNRLCDKFDNIKLNLIGNGPALNKVRELSYENGNIHIFGRVENSEVMKILGSSNIFVNPSRAEGMPTSILESGAMQCAVVATPVGGTTEIIPDENYGIFCEVNDNSIYEKLEVLIQNKKEIDKLGKNLQKRILDKFTWDKVADKIINIADELSVK